MGLTEEALTALRQNDAALKAFFSNFVGQRLCGVDPSGSPTGPLYIIQEDRAGGAHASWPPIKNTPAIRRVLEDAERLVSPQFSQQLTAYMNLVSFDNAAELRTFFEGYTKLANQYLTGQTIARRSPHL
jgi:hypothetical protein